MGSNSSEDQGPDLSLGVTLADFGDKSMLRGHVGDDAVLLARVGDEVLAVAAHCTHYGGPLAEGILAGETVRCPLHHACFSLRNGEALGAPAFDALDCWNVVRDGERYMVRERRPATSPAKPEALHTDALDDVVIIGGGAAGFACAEMLRRRGYEGRLTILSDDSDAPCDRPNLSKDYLSGEAPEDWIPLRSEDFYAENDMDLQLNAVVTKIDAGARRVATADGRIYPFQRLLIATGAEPVRLPIPGADGPHVFTLRSLADSRAIIARAAHATSVVVLGSGFIGLEAAAALRMRGLDVHVVSRDARPMERVLGAEFGDFIRGLHEQHGVAFHIERTIASIGVDSVQLDDGTTIAADLVILGVGVRPRTALAHTAGIPVDHGILVDEYLETSLPGVYAAGDVARWHDPGHGAGLRVEHWVVAERQGQVVAENMLGARQAFLDVPFFWSAHYDTTIRYAGHALSWDAIEIEGSPAERDCLARYITAGKVMAVAAIGRDADVLHFTQKPGGTR